MATNFYFPRENTQPKRLVEWAPGVICNWICKHTIHAVQSSDGTSSNGSPLAVGIVFFGYGFISASAFSRMPAIRDQLGSTPTQLSFALVWGGIGIVLGSPFTGRLVDRYSSRVVSVAATLITLTGWALVPMAYSIPILALMFFIIGAGGGAAGVAVNIQGSLVEKRRKKVWMPYWHGLFSIGAVVGAVAAAFAAFIKLAIGWQFLTVSALWAVVIHLATIRFIPDANLQSNPKSKPTENKAGQQRQLVLPPTVILLGIIALAACLGESAAHDWLALILVDNRMAAPALGAISIAGFDLTMTLGRFTGGTLIQRYGRTPVLRVAGVLACIGVGALCLINSTPVALLGASAWGLGLSVVFPAAISAAGEIPNRGSQAIATVATIGYGGFLLGAPLIGFLAHSMPLDKALLAVAVIVLLIAILASAARERGITPRPVSNLISSHGSS